MNDCNGCVLLLHFDEPQGSTTFHDDSGFGNDATCSGPLCPAIAVNGISGSGLLFDGLDDFLFIASSTLLNVQEQLTLEAWFKVSDNAQQPIIEWNDGTNSGVHMWTNVYGFQWGGKGTGANLVDTTGNEFDYVISTHDPPINQWHHLAVTYNQTTGIAQVYLDGSLAQEQTLGTFIPQTSYDLYLGKRPTLSDGLHLHGLMDEVAIYDRVLTTGEILDH